MRVRESACIKPEHQTFYKCFFTNPFFPYIHQGPSGDPGSAGAPGPPGPMVSSLHRLRKHVPLSSPIRSETKRNRGSLEHVFPRFSFATCIRFRSWLVRWIVCVLYVWPKWLLWFCFMTLLNRSIILFQGDSGGRGPRGQTGPPGERVSLKCYNCTLHTDMCSVFNL